MSDSQQALSRGRLQARTGFTLVELVLVLAMVGILSGLAVPSLTGLSRAEAHMAATRMRSLLVFCQEWAIGTGRSTWVGYDADAKRMQAFQARQENTAYARRVALLDPLNGTPLAVDLSDVFRSTDPIRAQFGSFPTLKFDESGACVDSEGQPLTSDVLIPLTQGVGVRIRAGTGLIGVH